MLFLLLQASSNQTRMLLLPATESAKIMLPIFLLRRVNIDLMTQLVWEEAVSYLPIFLCFPLSLSPCCWRRVCRENPRHYIFPPATLTLVVKTHIPVIDFSLSLSGNWHYARILIYNIWSSKGWGQVLNSCVVLEAVTDGVELISAGSRGRACEPFCSFTGQWNHIQQWYSFYVVSLKFFYEWPLWFL